MSVRWPTGRHQVYELSDKFQEGVGADRESARPQPVCRGGGIVLSGRAGARPGRWSRAWNRWKPPWTPRRKTSRPSNRPPPNSCPRLDRCWPALGSVEEQIPAVFPRSPAPAAGGSRRRREQWAVGSWQSRHPSTVPVLVTKIRFFQIPPPGRGRLATLVEQLGRQQQQRTKRGPTTETQRSSESKFSKSRCVRDERRMDFNRNDVRDRTIFGPPYVRTVNFAYRHRGKQSAVTPFSSQTRGTLAVHGMPRDYLSYTTCLANNGPVPFFPAAPKAGIPTFFFCPLCLSPFLSLGDSPSFWLPKSPR